MVCVLFNLFVVRLNNKTGYAIRVPAGSVETLGLESIPLNDGSGDVWVSMNIYHHLHCLVGYLRRTLINL